MNTQDIREVAARLGSAAEEIHTNTAAINEATELIQELHDEVGTLRARLDHVRAVRDRIGTVMPIAPGGTEQDNGRWMAYDDVLAQLNEALDGVAW